MELHTLLPSSLPHDNTWRGRLAYDHPLDTSKDEKISNHKSHMEVHHLHNQMSTQRRRGEQCRAYMSSHCSPLFCSLEVICSPTNLSHTPSASQATPRQSWTRASLRLVSVQTKFGGPGIVTFQALPELLHRDSAGMNPSFMGKTGHVSCSRNRHRLAL